MSVDGNSVTQENPLKAEPSLTPTEKLNRQIEASREAVNALVAFSLANGEEKSKFDHLDQVWDPFYFSLVPDKDLVGRAAVTDLKEGFIFIGENRADNFHTVFHESIHRAAFLKRKKEGRAASPDVIAGLYGFTINADDKSVEPLDQKSLAEISEQARPAYLENWRQQIRLINELFEEGVTEWVVQRANGLTAVNGKPIVVGEDGGGYSVHLDLIDAIRQYLEGKKMSKDQFDALLIETALTGDMTSMVQKMGENTLYLVSELIPILADFVEYRKGVVSKLISSKK